MQLEIPSEISVIMASLQSALTFILLLTVTLHLSFLCGVISVGSETQSTAVTLHESETEEIQDSEEDGLVETELQEDLEIFEPTDEWQTIKEGQAIPAGLHVRINLATGEKEAKLLDEGDKSTQFDQQRKAEEKTIGEEGEEQHAMEDLQRRMAKMEGDDCEDNNCNADNQALIEEVKKRYRSIEELKKEFAELQLNVETDYEIMARLIKEYNNSETTERRKLILQDLEYYVHQVDNAVDLQGLGGWDIILAALNSSEEDIQIEAAHVLGSAVQSNPKAQVIAFDGGALQSLIYLVAHSPSHVVQKRALFGLSSLVRFFPYAQQRFLQLGGLNVLTSLMRSEEAEMFPIKVKGVTLLHDLLVEKENAVKEDHLVKEDDQRRERRVQYQNVQLAPRMVEQGWCDLVPTLLDVVDHDAREKILLTLQTLFGHCSYETESELHKRLESLRREYQPLVEEELSEGETEGYFTDLSKLVDKLIKQIS